MSFYIQDNNEKFYVNTSSEHLKLSFYVMRKLRMYFFRLDFRNLRTDIPAYTHTRRSILTIINLVYCNHRKYFIVFSSVIFISTFSLFGIFIENISLKIISFNYIIYWIIKKIVDNYSVVSHLST